MARPTFFVAGCGKCGTTTLCHLLGRHPEVFVTDPKEPNFLSDEAVYARGWDWYESLFEPGRDRPARGEGSVSYTLAECETRVAARVARHLPEVKILYIARNPFRRLESVFREKRDCGWREGYHLPRTLREAVAARPQMWLNSLYWRRTEALRRVVPAERRLFLCLEDLEADPRSVLRRCFRFLGVDPDFELPDPGLRLNEGRHKRYDTALLERLRGTALAELIPSRVRDRWLRRPFGGEAVAWDPELRRDFARDAAGDVERYLAACGKPPDFWGKEFR